MDVDAERLRVELRELLQRTIEVRVALDLAEGRVPAVAVPHYSLIEAAAHEVGREVSRGAGAAHGRADCAAEAVGQVSHVRPALRIVRAEADDHIRRQPGRVAGVGGAMSGLSPEFFSLCGRKWGLRSAN